LPAREVPGPNAIDSGGEECKPPTGPLLPQLLLPSNQSRTSRRAKEPAARATTILTPTAEPPQYRLTIGEMAGGRRLMSDDVAFLEGVAGGTGGGGGDGRGSQESARRAPAR